MDKLKFRIVVINKTNILYLNCRKRIPVENLNYEILQ